MFITLEGIDGSGKSTQARLLLEKLKKSSVGEILLTKEPGGSSLGLLIREIVLERKYNISRETEILLFLADRTQHINEVILPAIKDDKIVICERYCDSTEAYQIYGMGMCVEALLKLHEWISGIVIPDVTFLLDLSVDSAFLRISERGCIDGMENRGNEFLNKVRDGYMRIALRDSPRIVLIDAEKNEDEVHVMIWNEIKKRMSINDSIENRSDRILV